MNSVKFQKRRKVLLCWSWIGWIWCESLNKTSDSYFISFWKSFVMKSYLKFVIEKARKLFFPSKTVIFILFFFLFVRKWAVCLQLLNFGKIWDVENSVASWKTFFTLRSFSIFFVFLKHDLVQWVTLLCDNKEQSVFSFE